MLRKKIIENIKNNESNISELEQEILAESTLEINLKEKIMICKILSIRENGYDIQFGEYGITIPVHNVDRDLLKETVEVFYESEIGKPDFKYFVKYN